MCHVNVAVMLMRWLKFPLYAKWALRVRTRENSLVHYVFQFIVIYRAFLFWLTVFPSLRTNPVTNHVRNLQGEGHQRRPVPIGAPRLDCNPPTCPWANTALRQWAHVKFIADNVRHMLFHSAWLTYLTSIGGAFTNTADMCQSMGLGPPSSCVSHHNPPLSRHSYTGLKYPLTMPSITFISFS